MNRFNLPTFFLIAATGIGIGLTSQVLATQTTIADLVNSTDFHGISVDPNDPSRIYLATHTGLFVTDPDGEALSISDFRADFMGFSPDPTNPDVFYGSGHPATGGNLGIVKSEDGGITWSKISDGVNGPVDFHQMDVSKANPNIIVGNSQGLQISKDAGQSWQIVAPSPEGTIDLAASAIDENILYSATRTGIIKSVDAGISWTSAHPSISPATMIATASDGNIYAFMIGTGLIRAAENELDWQILSNNFGDQFMLHFAIDPSNAQNMYAVTLNQQARKLAIIASTDGGINWKVLGEQ